MTLLSQLNSQSASKKKRVFLGFDGAIDTILNAVDQRSGSGSNYTTIPTISAWAKRLQNAAGKSTNIELVPLETRMGGNAVLSARALSALETDVTLVADLGLPMREIFQPLSSKMKVFSVAEPCQTDAVEFTDGKILLSQPASLGNLSFETIRDLLENESQLTLREFFCPFDGFVFTNWTMMLQASDIYQKLLPILPNNRLFFFDLADPEKRSTHDILRLLDLLQLYSQKGSCYLSLNRKEAQHLANILNFKREIHWENNHGREFLEMLLERFHIFGEIHDLVGAESINSHEYQKREGFFTPNPKTTTGGGDHFNAGMLYGLLQKWSLADCLDMGNANSGYYVRNGKSPSLSDIRDFIKGRKN